MSIYKSIEEAISKATGNLFRIVDRSPIGGGCINQAEKLEGSRDAFFLKTNRASFLPQFDNEIASLRELAETQAIRVPTPIASGTSDGKSYLVLEYIPQSRPGKRSWEILGQQLANLHRFSNPRFGWNRNNAIGANPQINTPRDNWINFYQEHRLTFQIDLAAHKGFRLANSKALLESIPLFFADYEPEASLLHGDLWSGNVSFDHREDPFLFDPCCYYGDRETDIAFTEFFGGFDPRFYKSYNEAYPLNSGYEQRRILYNLYHCLNHYNLFGSPYDRQASAMVSDLLTAI